MIEAPTPDAILREATREAADLTALFTADGMDRAELFQAMDQHALTLRLASAQAGIPAVARDMHRLWGEALLQRQLLRLTMLCMDRGIRAEGVSAYPQECKLDGKLNVTAAMSHAFSVLISALEKEPA